MDKSYTIKNSSWSDDYHPIIIWHLIKCVAPYILICTWYLSFSKSSLFQTCDELDNTKECLNSQYRLIGAGLARLDLDKNFTFDQMSKLLSDNNHQISNSALSSAQFIAYMLYFKRHRFCIQHNGSIIQINKLCIRR